MSERTTAGGVEPEDRGGQIGQVVGDTAEQAGEAVREQVDDRSTAAGRQVVAAGAAVRRAGAGLRGRGGDLPGQLAERAGEQMERAGRYLRDSDGDAILRDAEDFGRRRPLVVLGVALAVGLAVGRLLKASRAGRRRVLIGR